MDIQKEREAFEKYIQTVAHPHRSPKVMFFTVNDGHGNVIYCDISIQNQWETWLAAKVQAVPEWINVNDKLPPANILVLGMSQTRSNLFNIYNVMALDEFEEADVTYWMHLPEAPKTQEQSHD
ncbi:DUF551 domain-containing protein [Acinetobacter sp. 10FS3-1]|uniref:DUF551 domain-containing protein n=1 Tax=Acinetobacter sp. 10FS3-1 TaxID=2563897 RepID=UPI00157D40CE|nr:DUF551 domain-containing protein [Acinetobacter sp. 10FS3-1]QKQ69893.1 DUF551 domain-containing protein [Acinetobacter sp. 10FS3-1]